MQGKLHESREDTMKKATLRGAFAFAALLGGIAVVKAQTLADLDPPQALIDAAKKEGVVMLYTSMNDVNSKQLLTAFEKRYGVKGETFRAPTAPLVQRFATEFDGSGTQADIFSVASPLPFKKNPEWFAPLDRSFAPNLANWPASGVHERHYTWTNEILALAYNTEHIKPEDAPKTWAQIIDPKWKGRIVLSDPRAADNYMGWLDAIEASFGIEFLRKLGTQDFKLTPSGASGVQLVAAGSSLMNFPTIATFATPLIDKKAPIAVLYPSEPQLASARDIAVVAKAPHPNAARLFLNWTLSLEATKLYCSVNAVAVVGDPDGKAGCIPLKGAKEVNFEVSEERARMLARELGLQK